MNGIKISEFNHIKGEQFAFDRDYQLRWELNGVKIGVRTTRVTITRAQAPAAIQSHMGLKTEWDAIGVYSPQPRCRNRSPDRYAWIGLPTPLRSCETSDLVRRQR